MLATDSNAAAAFVNGIFPADAVEAARKQHEMAEKAGLQLVDTTPAPAMQPEVPMVEGQKVFGEPTPTPSPFPIQ